MKVYLSVLYRKLGVSGKTEARMAVILRAQRNRPADCVLCPFRSAAYELATSLRAAQDVLASLQLETGFPTR